MEFLGKKGLLTELLKQLGRLPSEERPKVGAAVNEAKQALQALIETKKAELIKKQLDRQLAEEMIDNQEDLIGRCPRCR